MVGYFVDSGRLYVALAAYYGDLKGLFLAYKYYSAKEDTLTSNTYVKDHFEQQLQRQKTFFTNFNGSISKLLF